MLGLVFHPNSRDSDRNRQRMSADDIARLIVTFTARDFALESSTLLGATRGSPRAAHGRQVAMYLAHVTFALDFVAIGSAFKRDRTTVAHACRVVENRRDDPEFDQQINKLELLLVSAFSGGGQ